MVCGTLKIDRQASPESIKIYWQLKWFRLVVLNLKVHVCLLPQARSAAHSDMHKEAHTGGGQVEAHASARHVEGAQAGEEVVGRRAVLELARCGRGQSRSNLPSHSPHQLVFKEAESHDSVRIFNGVGGPWWAVYDWYYTHPTGSMEFKPPAGYCLVSTFLLVWLLGAHITGDINVFEMLAQTGNVSFQQWETRKTSQTSLPSLP